MRSPPAEIAEFSAKRCTSTRFPLVISEISLAKGILLFFERAFFSLVEIHRKTPGYLYPLHAFGRLAFGVRTPHPFAPPRAKAPPYPPRKCLEGVRASLPPTESFRALTLGRQNLTSLSKHGVPDTPKRERLIFFAADHPSKPADHDIWRADEALPD